MDKNKKAILWLLLFLVIIVITVGFSTYAYYVARERHEGTFDVDITSKGVDTLEIRGSDKVIINANVYNFAEDNGSDLSGSCNIDIDLQTTKKESKYCYEVNAILPDEVIFAYSNGTVPELLLTISKSDDGQNYTDVIEKLDVTTRTGSVAVPVTYGDANYKHEIIATKDNPNTDYWKATLTMVYFKDVNQSINNHKSYNVTLKANVVEC